MPGEINNAINLGVSGEGLFVDKVVDLRFKKLKGRRMYHISDAESVIITSRIIQLVI